MGIAVNRVVHAALSQAFDDIASGRQPNPTQTGVWVGSTLSRLNHQIRRRIADGNANKTRAIELINTVAFGPSDGAQPHLAEAFVIYENAPLGPVTGILVPPRLDDPQRYFPNYLQRHRDLFHEDPPQFHELGVDDPMQLVTLVARAAGEMQDVEREMGRLGLTPRILQTALVQITPDDVSGEHLRSPVQRGMALGGALRDAITRYNINQLPRQRGLALPPNLCNINWNATEITLTPGDVYDKIVTYVRSAMRLFSHYGQSSGLSQQAWLARQPYFCALLRAAGTRGLSLPRDVMSWLRTHVIKTPTGSTAPVVESTAAEDTYANRELLAEQAADLAALANLRPLRVPTHRRPRSINLDA